MKNFSFSILELFLRQKFELKFYCFKKYFNSKNFKDKFCDFIKILYQMLKGILKKRYIYL